MCSIWRRCWRCGRARWRFPARTTTATTFCSTHPHAPPPPLSPPRSCAWSPLTATARCTPTAKTSPTPNSHASSRSSSSGACTWRSSPPRGTRTTHSATCAASPASSHTSSSTRSRPRSHPASGCLEASATICLPAKRTRNPRRGTRRRRETRRRRYGAPGQAQAAGGPGWSALTQALSSP